MVKTSPPLLIIREVPGEEVKARDVFSTTGKPFLDEYGYSMQRMRVREPEMSNEEILNRVREWQTRSTAALSS